MQRLLPLEEMGEGRLDTETQGRGHAKTGAEVGVMWPQAKDAWLHQKPSGGPDRLSLGSPEGASPANTLSSDSGLQSWETIHFCYVTPPRVWFFVMLVPGN